MGQQPAKVHSPNQVCSKVSPTVFIESYTQASVFRIAAKVSLRIKDSHTAKDLPSCNIAKRTNTNEELLKSMEGVESQ